MKAREANLFLAAAAAADQELGRDEEYQSRDCSCSPPKSGAPPPKWTLVNGGLFRASSSILRQAVAAAAERSPLASCRSALLGDTAPIGAIVIAADRLIGDRPTETLERDAPMSE